MPLFIPDSTQKLPIEKSERPYLRIFLLVGTAASLLCLVDCVLTPVVLAFSPTLAALLPGSNTTHRSLIFFVPSLGLLAFLSGSS
jgi:MerC mercury resistance protein